VLIEKSARHVEKSDGANIRLDLGTGRSYLPSCPTKLFASTSSIGPTKNAFLE
jgi:hypothetical protein